MKGITIENVDIPVESETIILKASLYSNENTPDKAPWVIVCTGLLGDRESHFPKLYIEKFVNSGYYALCYDHRAHGETAKQTGKNWIKLLPKIFRDIHDVISWILSNKSNQLLNDEIILFGISFSGALVLSQGYIDERAKKIIALATRHDYRTIKYKFPDFCIDEMSCKNYIKYDPEGNNRRILLAHCKDDKEIEFFNIYKIQEHMGLSDENLVIYEDGGHTFRNHRDDLFDHILKFSKKL